MASSEKLHNPICEETMIHRVEKAGLARWKLEALTGLLGYRALKHHQHEAERNQQAENRAVRMSAWGSKEKFEEVEDVGGHTILGDVTQPTPVVITHSSDNSISKILTGAAIATTLLGIPGAGLAGYVASKLLNTSNKHVSEVKSPTTDESLDVGLGRFNDLLDGAK